MFTNRPALTTAIEASHCPQWSVDLEVEVRGGEATTMIVQGIKCVADEAHMKDPHCTIKQRTQTQTAPAIKAN